MCVYTYRHTDAYACTHTPAADEYLARPDIVSSMRRSGACHVVCGYCHSVALLKNEQLFAVRCLIYVCVSVCMYVCVCEYCRAVALFKKGQLFVVR